MSRDDLHQHGPDCDHRRSPKVHREPPPDRRWSERDTGYFRRNEDRELLERISAGDRPLPPSQPQGWIDPDPLYVEPERVDPRVPYHGWESMRERWARADREPASHRTAVTIVAGCIALAVAVILLLLAAPRSAANDIPTPDSAGFRASFEDRSSGNLSQPTGAPFTVAPRAVAGHSGAPSPTGGIGTALIGGWATYYATCSDCAAAGPLLQAVLGPHWKGQTITVVSDHRQVDLRLVTSCACGDRTRNGETRPTIIDVSLEAFGELAGVAAGSKTDPGFVEVSIEIPGPHTTLPPTDTPRSPADLRMMLEVHGDELYR